MGAISLEKARLYEKYRLPYIFTVVTLRNRRYENEI